MTTTAEAWKPPSPVRVSHFELDQGPIVPTDRRAAGKIQRGGD
jgi:hypothetical protein